MCIRDSDSAPPPWKRFGIRKGERFLRFKSSILWKTDLILLPPMEFLAFLGVVMNQSINRKTISYSGMMLERVAFVYNSNYKLSQDHPPIIDSRIKKLSDLIPGIFPLDALLRDLNVVRLSSRQQAFSVGDLDAALWLFSVE
jgi:hypothetical protein